MKINEASELVAKAMEKHRRLMLVGAPGIGKTDAHIQACQRLDWDYIGLCSAIEDPSTIRGYPVRENGGATHCLFDGIHKAMHAERPTLLVFDDLGEASESTMKAILRFIQFGEIDGRKLPEHVVIHAATNDVQHGAGVYGMIEPLKTRFHSIVQVETDIDAVVAFGLARDWPTDLLAFLRNSPDSLHDWKPGKTMHIEGACPRGWSYVAGWIGDGIETPEVISGCVGKGNAAKYLAFRDLMSELPDIDDVLDNPEKAKVPTNPSAKFLISMALASKISDVTFGRALVYLNRLPAMFRAFSIRDAFQCEQIRGREKTLKKGYKPIATSKDFQGWAVSADGKEIVAAATA